MLGDELFEGIVSGRRVPVERGQLGGRHAHQRVGRGGRRGPVDFGTRSVDPLDLVGKVLFFPDRHRLAIFPARTLLISSQQRRQDGSQSVLVGIEQDTRIVIVPGRSVRDEREDVGSNDGF